MLYAIDLCPSRSWGKSLLKFAVKLTLDSKSTEDPFPFSNKNGPLKESFYARKCLFFLKNSCFSSLLTVIFITVLTVFLLWLLGSFRPNRKSSLNNHAGPYDVDFFVSLAWFYYCSLIFILLTIWIFTCHLKFFMEKGRVNRRLCKQMSPGPWSVQAARHPSSPFSPHVRDPKPRPHIPIGVLLRGEEGNVTCLRLFLGLRTRIRACLQEKLTAGSWGWKGNNHA